VFENRAESGRRPGGVWGRLALMALAILVVATAGRQLAGLIPGFASWVRELGPLGPLAFIVGYAAAAVAFVPGSFLTVTAGAVFGMWAGTVYVLLGATLGAAAAFTVSRHFARGLFERRLVSDPRFVAIDHAIAHEGWKVAFLLRLSPLFPFTLLNYALGLTRIRFADFLLASAGMLPGTLLYVYSGKVAGDLAAVAAGRSPTHGLGSYLVLGLGLTATLLAARLVSRLARRALTEATGGLAP
jgi:uncharacterized membrane protein YdjX (TVP38/TMEM64 family)